MSAPVKQTTHLLFSGFPAWGHVRPFCIFGARLVKEHENVVITILLAPNLFKKAQSEISSEFSGDIPIGAQSRIRLLSAFQSDTEDPFVLFPLLVNSYPALYQDLLESKPVSCAKTGTIFGPVLAPNIIVLDLIASPLINATRQISGKSLPVISWITGHVSSVMQIFAPTSILLEGGQSYGSTGGHIVKVPGLPDMYDWEFFPQEVPLEIDVSVIIKMANEGLEGSDAAFITTGYAAEEVATDALKAWYAKRQQGCYVIGPLVPPKTSNPAEGMTGSAETEEFLNKMFQSHGEKSVVYMSFGTVFWPTKQDYIGEVINAFIEKNMPFIICYASPFASLSEDLIVKINSSGIGLVSKWVPQQYILNHPATGWFVTHGGHNSVMEALGSGIPMICWPFEGDQPAAAAYLSVNLKVAFELLEVRTGEKGLKPLLRSGKQAKGTKEAVAFEIREVIDACRGPEGKALRNNAEKIKDRLKKAWETGGSSRSELQSFCEKFNVDLIFFRQSALRVEASR